MAYINIWLGQCSCAYYSFNSVRTGVFADLNFLVRFWAKIVILATIFFCFHVSAERRVQGQVKISRIVCVISCQIKPGEEKFILE